MKQTANKNKTRIGIFRGTFDPIHKGHVAFANQAVELAKLDFVYFVPEKAPQHKKAVGDFEDRLADITQAIKPCPNLRLLKLPSMSGSIQSILPELRSIFGNARLVFLMGSDVAKTIYHWHDVNSLCRNNELVVGMRKGDNAHEIEKMIAKLSVKPLHSKILDAPLPEITSSVIRNKKLAETV